MPHEPHPFREPGWTHDGGLRLLASHPSNVGARLVWWDPIVESFCFLIQYLGDCGGGLYCENCFFPVFFQIFSNFFIFHFFPDLFSVFLVVHCFIFLADPIFAFFPNNYALLHPDLKKNIQTIFPGGTSWVAQILNNIIVWMVLYCAHQLWGLKKTNKPFFHLSLGKAGPFTSENNIHVKALKCKKTK